jgi:hypothetical protein
MACKGLCILEKNSMWYGASIEHGRNKVAKVRKLTGSACTIVLRLCGPMHTWCYLYSETGFVAKERSHSRLIFNVEYLNFSKEGISTILGFALGRKLASLCYGPLVLRPFSCSFWNESLSPLYFWAMALRLNAESRDDVACTVV